MDILQNKTIIEVLWYDPYVTDGTVDTRASLIEKITYGELGNICVCEKSGFYVLRVITTRDDTGKNEFYDIPLSLIKSVRVCEEGKDLLRKILEELK